MTMVVVTHITSRVWAIVIGVYDIAGQGRVQLHDAFISEQVPAQLNVPQVFSFNLQKDSLGPT